MSRKHRPKTIFWIGVRSIYLFGRKRDGTNVFEERVVVFSGKTIYAAHAKARKEADKYARGLKLKRHPMQIGYIQDGDELIDGYEVWSELYESQENLNSFVKCRYDKYEYHRDE